jgi:hypothetical protein
MLPSLSITILIPDQRCAAPSAYLVRKMDMTHLAPTNEKKMNLTPFFFSA